MKVWVNSGMRIIIARRRFQLVIFFFTVEAALFAGCKSSHWNEAPLAPFVQRVARHLSCSLKGKNCPDKVNYDASTDQALFDAFRGLYDRLSGRSSQSQEFYFADLKPYQEKDSAEAVVAVCDKKRKKIFIGQALWEQTDGLTQEMLILHELGHCVGMLGHNEKMLNFEKRCAKLSESSLICFVERPESLMHPNLFHPDLYRMFQSDYFDNFRRMHGS